MVEAPSWREAEERSEASGERQRPSKRTLLVQTSRQEKVHVLLSVCVPNLDERARPATFAISTTRLLCDVSTPNPDHARWFSEEVQPHEGSLRAYIGRSLASRDDIDDVVQDSYLKLWRIRAAGAIKSPRAFLFTVARNVALDLRRRRSVTYAEPITESVALPVLENSPGVVDFVSRQQELALLAEAIRTLPARCQQVFLLRKIQGLSQRDIAARLGISENTVETLVGKGARRCTDYFRERGIIPASPSRDV
jgi:RNA polymerase sigma-70 factor (ECF subfamily)